MTETVFPNNNEIVVEFTFRDREKKRFDPTAVKADVTDPNGGSTTYVFGTDPELTKISKGFYQIAFPVSILKTWRVDYYCDDTEIVADYLEIEVI